MKLVKQKGFLVLLIFLFISFIYAFLHSPQRAKTYGKIHVKGEVINTVYKKAIVLTKEREIYYFFIPRGKDIYTGDRVEIFGYAKRSYIRVNLIRIERNFIQRLRVKIHNTLKWRFLKTAKTTFERKLGLALLFGENWFSKKEKKKLSHLGIYHIIVISGMHYALLFSFFLLLPARWKFRYWVALGFFLFFTFLILFPKAPAYRAFISFALFLLAKIVERQYFSLKAILLAATFWILLYPHWLYNIGFWLSYLASLALVLYYGNERTPEENFLRNTFGKFLGLEAALVVMVVITPILGYYLHYVSLGSFLYSWIFTFWAELFLFIGVINMLTFWGFPPLLEIQHYIAKVFGEIFYKLPENVYLKISYIPKEVMFLLTFLGLILVSVPIRGRFIVLFLFFVFQVLCFLIL